MHKRFPVFSLVLAGLHALVAAPLLAQPSFTLLSTTIDVTESPASAQSPAQPPNRLNIFDRYDKPLGQGPHVLVLVFGGGNIRFDYKTGPLCQKAKNIITEQMVSISNNMFCVPIF
jgi:hypothetical protein